jgi:hypothetical protein
VVFIVPKLKKLINLPLQLLGSISLAIRKLFDPRKRLRVVKRKKKKPRPLTQLS